MESKTAPISVILSIVTIGSLIMYALAYIKII